MLISHWKSSVGALISTQLLLELINWELIKKLFLLQILIVKKKSCGPRCIENQTRLSKGAPSGIPVTLGMEEEFLSEDRMNKGQKAKDNDRKKIKGLIFLSTLLNYWILTGIRKKGG